VQTALETLPFFSGIDNLRAKYCDTLDLLRQPLSWHVYVGGISKLGDARVDAAFKQFMHGVLNGTFEEDRYKTTSAHIEKIREEEAAALDKVCSELGPKLSKKS